MKKPILGRLSDVDVRLLRVFKVVVETGGVTTAGLELNVGRSTISRHLKDLETRLGGLILCRRGRSGFSLTTEGKAVYDSTLQLLGALSVFRSDIDNLHKTITGQLVLSFYDNTISNPNSHITKAIQLFHDMAPDVELVVKVDNINKIENGLMDSTIHVGVLPTPSILVGLSSFPLFEEKMFLYCGKDHPLFEKEVKEEDILSHAYAGLGYHSPNMAMSRTKSLRKSAVAYDQEALAALICSGRFLGFLPEHFAKSMIMEEKVKKISLQAYEYDVEYSAVARSSPKPSRIVQAFLDCLEEVHSFSSRHEQGNHSD